MRLLRRITATALAVLVVAAIFLAGWNAATYGVPPWQAVPSQIHWCGRDYVNTTGVRTTLSQIKGMAPGPIRNVGHYLPLNAFGAELYAAVTPDAQRNAVHPPLPCAMGVYLRTASGQYIAYTLSGGP